LSRDSYDENVQLVKRKHGISVPLEVDTGGIVGVVDVIDCVESHKSKWFEKGKFGWVLASPRRLKFRRCKGALNVFRPEYENERLPITDDRWGEARGALFPGAQFAIGY